MRREKQVQFLAAAIFIVMALIAAVPFWLGRSIGVLTHESHQGLSRQMQLDEVLDLLRDAETAQRGFLLTDNDVFLEPYARAQRELPQILGQLAAQSRSGGERATVSRIAGLARRKQAEMDETIAVRRQAGLAAAERVVASLRGKRDMDALRGLISAETGRLQGQRDVLRAELLAASDESLLVSLGATLVNICVLGTLLVVLMRMLRERHASARLLSVRAAQLEAAAEQATRYNRELLVIAEMLRAIEALPSNREAGPVIARYLPLLLPGLGGSFFLLRDEDGLLARQAQWGTVSGQPAEMELDACSAIGSGVRHGSGGAAAACSHLRGAHDGGAPHLCVPLVSREELIGMLHLQGLAPDPWRREEQERLALTAAEQLALALGNARLRESLRRQSLLDPLTGLFNRRYFDETLKRELGRAHRKAMPLSLLVLDIDHFKRVNDSFGHAAGDAVLRTVAQQIRAWTREGDVACRYGGEEFVVLLPECGVDVASGRAERLREAIAATLLDADGGGPERVTASVGVAEYPNHGGEAESLFWAADKALYRAKQMGRNRVVTVGD